MFPKFIIEEHPTLGKCIVFSNVKYHRNLTNFPERVLSGGWWSQKDFLITFNGSSEEFGAATIEMIKECVDSNKIFTNNSFKRPLSNKFTFKYKTLANEIINL